MKDPQNIQENSFEIPFEEVTEQQKHMDSDKTQFNLKIDIETGLNMQKTEQICPEQLHSSLEKRDFLDSNTKPRVTKEHFTPHVQDTIGAVYQNATTEVHSTYVLLMFLV